MPAMHSIKQAASNHTCAFQLILLMIPPQVQGKVLPLLSKIPRYARNPAKRIALAMKAVMRKAVIRNIPASNTSPIGNAQDTIPDQDASNGQGEILSWYLNVVCSNSLFNPVYKNNMTSKDAMISISSLFFIFHNIS
ncbi:hypothetical protein DXN04_01780 [Chitinophaga silvisoli]|uniref:Uncharacterized protein n=1 Tax=Chitinophaga silvisoli TaxID=2291814 RepID=A0A3E1P7W5_9BACT|nr:hypothetical protein DXN04_01780 [Chitinophaga silvisoli]